jgi:hypothetical protein
MPILKFDHWLKKALDIHNLKKADRSIIGKWVFRPNEPDKSNWSVGLLPNHQAINIDSNLRLASAWPIIFI